ncbi:MAG: lactate utilization protein [Chloroflexi bacterium]|nr:lactate utilization protein [Chloroflexota bacterium]
MTTLPRDQILNSIRTTLKATTRAPLPSAARIAPRLPGDTEAEIALLLSEIEKLGGTTCRIANVEQLRNALRELVQKEKIAKSTAWETKEMKELGIAETLAALGVTIISPDASPRALAECDLGITGVDAALPETGTLVLRSSHEHPQLVSLLPPVHLAIFRPSALRADLQNVFAEIKSDKRAVLVTGPSRTTDIEKVLTIGVHGPKAMYVWCMEETTTN